MRGPGRAVGAGSVLAAAAGLLIGSAAGAQEAPELRSVDTLVADGRVAQARQELQQWWDARWSGADRGDRQHGLWLRGVLTVDPSQALQDYQRLVLEYPGGRFTARALLRLAQAADARGRTLEAAGRYRQLVQEYPDTPEQLEARRWLEGNREAVSRARAAAEVAGASDTAAARGPDAGARAPTDTADAAETAGASPAGTDTLAPGDTAAPEVPTPGPPDTVEIETEEEAPVRVEVADRVDGPELPVAVQLGAFSTPERARLLAERAREEGFQVRLVRVDGSELIRVRSGRFPDRSAARDLRDRLRGTGMDAVIVTDAREERPIR